jgi:cold shock protein
MSMPEQPLHIFISHSSKDIVFVSQLAYDLRKELGDEQTIWYDVQNLKGGDSWWSSIVEQLEKSTIFLLVLSPYAMQSPWVLDEINMALRLKNGPEKLRFISLLYKSCKPRHDLLNITTINFKSPQSYKEAFLKLLTTLGVHKSIETVPPGSHVQQASQIHQEQSQNFSRAMPQIFVSCSSKDAKFGNNLVGHLREAIADRVVVCYDLHDELKGSNTPWDETVEELLNSDVFLPIVTVNSMRSPWLKDEINLTWSRKNSQSRWGMRIIPVQYEPCHVRLDLRTLQIISFLPPTPYEEAFNVLLDSVLAAIKSLPVQQPNVKGKVKKVIDDRRFGFIRAEDGNEYFAHLQEVRAETLTEGQKVVFDVVDSPKGRRAQNVRRLRTVE